MDESVPILVRRGEGVTPPGPATPGMDRHQLLDRGAAWVGWVRTDPGIAGGWHHHGDRESYIYILRGNVDIEFPGGTPPPLTASIGDFIFVPARTVHREVSGAGDAPEFFIIRIGAGPLTVNVADPDEDPYSGS